MCPANHLCKPFMQTINAQASELVGEGGTRGSTPLRYDHVPCDPLMELHCMSLDGASSLHSTQLNLSLYIHLTALTVDECIHTRQRIVWHSLVIHTYGMQIIRLHETRQQSG